MDPDSEELRDYQPGLAHLKDLASKVREGDVVTGPVVSEVEGGLLVDIGTGVHAFLHADQVDSAPRATFAPSSAAPFSAW